MGAGGRRQMSRSLKLLLVADSEEDAGTALPELEDKGFSAAWRRVDTEPALLQALRTRWDAIVADDLTTHLDAMQVLQIVKQHDPDVPVVLLWSDTALEPAVDAMREGARYCLPRSRLGRLGQVVAREIDEAEQQRNRLAASNALAFQHRRYRSIFENAPVALLELDLSGARRYVAAVADPEVEGIRPGTELLRGAVERIRVLAANAAALELLGAPSTDHLQGSQIVRGDPAAWIDIVNGLHGSAPTFEREVPIGRMDGQELTVLLGFRVPRDLRHLRNLVVGMIDVTARRALEGRSRTAERMQTAGYVAGIVAHDFNNLLTVIKGYAGLLVDALPETEPMARDLRAIDEAASSAEYLARQLLTFGRSQHGEPEVLSVNQLLKGMVDVVQGIVGDGVEVLTVLADDLWPVAIDPNQLEQIVVNLTTNAREAMPGGGRLVFETRNAVAGGSGAAVPVPQGDWVLLSVSDTGCGMNEGVREQIFEPFFTTRQPRRGAGLGLSAVYGAVAQARGTIEVGSVPDEGTTFEILLPRHGG
jgi:two-component system, cell cycle sensor histidine kinase and response regulator CckA